MTDYTVLKDTNLPTLIDVVKIYMKDGWVCQGGICVSGGGDVFRVYYQAMIKA